MQIGWPRLSPLGWQRSCRTASNRVTGVAVQALDELQDYVDEASHNPWPGTRTPPRPYAETKGQALHMWYGGPDISSPVILACEPLPLADIERLR